MRIAFYHDNTGSWGPIEPGDVDRGGRGLGGRETALIQVSRRLADAGHQVDVYTNTSEAKKYTDRYRWGPFRRAYRPGIRSYDVGISFDGPLVWARGGLPARVHVVHEQCAHLPVGQLAPLVDCYFVLSNWQGWHLNHYDRAIDTDKMVTVYNGIDLARYNGPAPGPRHPHRIFYSSSPDRGLHHLLQAWPLVREQVPDAELWVYYEVDRWIPTVEWFMNELGRRAQIIKGYFQAPPAGVTFRGMVDQWTLAREQRQCTLWAYPADLTAGTETFCITGLEAAAAGCAMFTTQADCLPEIYGRVAALAALPLDVEGWAAGVVTLLTDEAERARWTPGISFARKYTWDVVADRWARALESLARGEWPALEGVEDDEDRDTGRAG